MYITKKDIPIPFSSSWACIGLCWLLWACVDLHWPSLAAVGLRGLRSNQKIKNKMYITKKDIPILRGPAFAFVGCCGPALTCIGRRWLLWAFVQPSWAS